FPAMEVLRRRRRLPALPHLVRHVLDLVFVDRREEEQAIEDTVLERRAQQRERRWIRLGGCGPQRAVEIQREEWSAPRELAVLPGNRTVTTPSDRYGRSWPGLTTTASIIRRS